jgi:leucyl aminopeptidase
LRFLEIHYKGAADKDEQPYSLVGKGITFDSGGISLKPSANMDLMKGDMGGAATVAGALYGICKLQLPVNIVAVIPLCENMPSGKATKPGDVVKAMNGKSIEVLNTDAEGRMILVICIIVLIIVCQNLLNFIFDRPMHFIMFLLDSNLSISLILPHLLVQWMSLLVKCLLVYLQTMTNYGIN